MIDGVTSSLSSHSKKSWPSFYIKLGIVTLSIVPHAKKEVASLKYLSLCIGTFKRHGLKGVVKKHFRMVKLASSY